MYVLHYTTSTIWTIYYIRFVQKCLDFKLTAKITVKSANRAFGLIMEKCKTIGDVSFGVVKKLYDSLVCRIMEHGAVIWGYKSYSCINNMQLRACRFFLLLMDILPTSAGFS